AAVGGALDGAVVGDVGEVEALDRPPEARVEGLGGLLGHAGNPMAPPSTRRVRPAYPRDVPTVSARPLPPPAAVWSTPMTTGSAASPPATACCCAVTPAGGSSPPSGTTTPRSARPGSPPPGRRRTRAGRRRCATGSRSTS